QATSHGLYQGIGAPYYGTAQNSLEYDLVVNPGADYRQIHMTVQGASSALVDKTGNLLLNTAGGQLVQQAPTLYQMVNGTKQAVTGNYVLTGGNQLGFSVGSYDSTRPLYIDPVLLFSTYLGGSGADQGLAVAVDGAGDTYVTGSTQSSNFPTLNPFQSTLAGTQNAFVAKLNAAGNALVYSTYLGGGATDVGNGLAIDLAGN